MVQNIISFSPYPTGCHLFATDDKITTAGYDLKPFSSLAVQWKLKINDKLVCLGEQG